MNRRNFVTTATAGLAASGFHGSAEAQNQQALIRPSRLKPGDLVGVITPSTPATNPDRLALVERTIKYFGLRVKWGKHIGKKSGYFGNPVGERLDDLHAMFQDPEVKGVFPIQGGYGAPQLLDGIDYDLIRRNPKIFIGYSDITALHLAIHKRTGLVTFHGPNVFSALTGYTQTHFRKAVFESVPIGVATNPPESNSLRPKYLLRTIRPGKATGRLVGGNLTLISTTMGTPYEIDTRGAILFLEDIGEEPYRIDRMLTQLRLAGKLDQAAGIIFGDCVGCAPNDYKPFVAAGFSLGESLDAILGSVKVPVLSGLTIGHVEDQLTLPLGVTATLDADAGTLEIKESGVS
ncbi:MAG: LD-carboxypeptidase [Acidobacteria bacterium]|nr:LD-carboxypeptidase [Acidobacteriota bacterium]